jgi:predicted regulator of Ras-like GTPase activity (Roadblock/LC7/MglB family)
MTKLEQIIYQFRSELGGNFVSTDVVGMNGISIAGGSITPDFNAEDGSARFAEVMKLAVKISNKIDLGKVDDNLVTTDKNYIISRFLGDGSYYWIVVVTTNGTLGTVRMLMNEFSTQIWDAIPHDATPAAVEAPEPEKGDKKKETKKETKKEEKPKRNIWADATPKEDKKKKSDEPETRTPFQYP